MTIEETKKLGIEFERRLNTIDPSTAIKAKLDTKTIYSYLNEFCIQYVKQLVLSQDVENKYAQQKIVSALGDLITKATELINKSEDIELNTATYEMPTDYLCYIKSVTKCTVNGKSGFVTNTYAKDLESLEPLLSIFNKGAIIRHPYITEEGGKFKLVYDSYTEPSNLEVTYVKQPMIFSTLKSGSYCELPYSSFDEIVNGAVNMFISKYKYLLALGANKSENKQQEDNQ